MKQLVYFLLIAPMFVGCSDDSGGNSDTDTTQLRIASRTVYEYDDDETKTYLYSYTGNKLIRIDEEGDPGNYQKFEYQGNNVSKMIFYRNGVADETYTFNYSGGLISSYGYVGDVETFTDLEVNQTGRITALEEFNSEGQLILTQTMGYDSAGNVTTLSETYGGITQNYAMQYDNKINPWRFTYPSVISAIYMQGANNMISGNQNGNVTITHEYNEHGYPTSSTRLVGGVPRLTVTYEYE